MFRRGDDRVRRLGRSVEQELEGLGVVSTYFIDLADIEDAVVVLRSLPYLLRVKKPRFAARGLSPA